ncbi:MAG: hypothetical protein Fur0022_35910 [Anaerolineales bacterium]
MKKNIGIWGPKGAGKTTYLSVLYHDCLANGWKMKAADEESDEFRLKNYKLLFEEGVFPIATRQQDVGVYTYDISRGGSFGVVQAYRLVLADASGEWFENPVQMRNLFPEITVNPYERLMQCDGLVLLLDPEEVRTQQTGHYVTISRALGALERFASNNSINKPIVPLMAVCFTKMDREKYRYIDLDGEKITEFARKILGDHIYQDILNACAPERVKFFGCSSIGIQENGKKGKMPVGTEQTKEDRFNPDNISPINIFKPIEWLLR